MSQSSVTVAEIATEDTNPFVGLIADLVGIELLVPLSAVAEVVRQVRPSPSDDQPAWIYGWLDWREQKVPLISYEGLVGGEKPPLPEEGHALVLNSLSQEADSLPFYALFIPVLPRSITLTNADRLIDRSSSEHSGAEADYLMRFAVGEQQLLVPDFDEIERRCREEIHQ